MHDICSIESTINRYLGRLVTPVRSRSSAHTTQFLNPTLTTHPENFIKTSSSIVNARGIGSVLVHSLRTQPGGYYPWWEFYQRSNLAPNKTTQRVLWTRRRSGFDKWPRGLYDMYEKASLGVGLGTLSRSSDRVDKNREPYQSRGVLGARACYWIKDLCSNWGKLYDVCLKGSNHDDQSIFSLL
jgi:hypothetical protein